MRQYLRPADALKSFVCGSLMADKESHPGRRPHACPYKAEIHDDDDSLCNCCDACEHKCQMEI